MWHETEAIVKERETAAAPGVVYALLVDVEAWRLWSPRIARVEPPSGRVTACRRRRLARLARPSEFSDRRDSA